MLIPFNQREAIGPVLLSINGLYCDPDGKQNRWGTHCQLIDNRWPVVNFRADYEDPTVFGFYSAGPDARDEPALEHYGFVWDGKDEGQYLSYNGKFGCQHKLIDDQRKCMVCGVQTAPPPEMPALIIDEDDTNGFMTRHDMIAMWKSALKELGDYGPAFREGQRSSTRLNIRFVSVRCGWNYERLMEAVFGKDWKLI